MKRNAAGLIYGNKEHYLDHLAPLCSLLEIPLLISDQNIANLAKNFYPNIKIINKGFKNFNFHVIENYNLIIYCTTRPFFEDQFFIPLSSLNKKIDTIWCPHGNSDKGWHSYHMEALCSEQTVLLYGKKMTDFLTKKNVLKKINKKKTVGNYRYIYFQKNKKFYQKLLREKIYSHLNPNNKTILYAPTWNDYENSSSFDLLQDTLIKKLPSDYNLIIKLHPNTSLKLDYKLYELIGKCEKNPNIILLSDFPSIYPLLNISDIYIGDKSSIGYDFLKFNRPMFFINISDQDEKDPSIFLFQSGITLSKDDITKIYDIIKSNLQHDNKLFKSVRKNLYNYVFEKNITIYNLKKQILP
jgi:teichoic acid glycerol-phosphate primase